MRYLRDRAFVLRRESSGDYDRRYTLYTEHHGLLVVTARGIGRFRSKQAGHLEPMSLSDVMVAHGKKIDRLAVASEQDGATRRHLCTSLSSVTIFGAICDAVARLTRPGIVDTHLFDLLFESRQALTECPAEPSPDRARAFYAAAMLKLLDRLGFGPALSDKDLTPPVHTLLLFMRRFPLKDLWQITAPKDVFHHASRVVDQALAHTPIEFPLHGSVSIERMLT